MSDLLSTLRAPEILAKGARFLPGFAEAAVAVLHDAILAIAMEAPFRHMVTPGGHAMSVAMTNCGPAGWVTDSHGYRYTPDDPLTGRPWPALPPLLRCLATDAAAAAGHAGFMADACLVNRYDPGARMGLHQDRNERDLAAPIVSVSLGLPAMFLFGGATRSVRPRKLGLLSGDVVVWGGPSRLVFHGIEPLHAGHDPICGPHRYNLTFRQAI
jgi:alkylated DNA repair protein (DNA oxidative demethylase)